MELENFTSRSLRDCMHKGKTLSVHSESRELLLILLQMQQNLSVEVKSKISLTI